MAIRKNKFNSLEIEVASSILYYDKNEMKRFFDIYDALSNENIAIDGIFDTFVNYLKSFKAFSSKPSIRKKKLVAEIKMKNEQNPNQQSRDLFDLWFSKVLDTEVPMELAEDVLNHFIWEEFKTSIESIDKMDIPFHEKISMRPKAPKALSNGGLISLADVDLEEKPDDQENFTNGVEEIDRVVQYSKTNFVVIAARPGVGKSMYMLNMAQANAKLGHKTLFLSLEMNKKQVTLRLLNNYANVNIMNQHKDEDGNLIFDSYNKAIKETRDSRGFQTIINNLILDECKKSSADTILADLEDFIKTEGFDVVFIDYLQLLKYNRLDEWASLRALTKELKNMAFRNNILMVTASQVSRESTQKGLALESLFGSTTIESDTDVVIGLELARERKQSTEAMVIARILKDREGDVGEFKLMVDYQTGRMTTMN